MSNYKQNRKVSMLLRNMNFQAHDAYKQLSAKGTIFYNTI